MPQLLKAESIIDKKLPELTKRCAKLKKAGIKPTMAVIQVGNNAASSSYIKNKKKLCEQIGATFVHSQLPEKISVKKFLAEVKKINTNKKIHGAIIQLPLPKQLQKLAIEELISPEKDIDGFHPQNIYQVFSGKPSTGLIPCTPKGIMQLLAHYEISLAQKNVAIIGRSLIVGKPLALLMTNQDATVTLCHSKTKDLAHITQQADIIVAAIGRAKFININHLSPNKNQVLIDVGINKFENALCGDIDFEAVKNNIAAITPVPGGVGPLTVLSLIENLLLTTENK
ncbi:MAG: bifunctional 5,10-methylenetetrahydrofolate dehydrogenase/5,10-methenyltetrahydrofolate cyclohydrolase [Bacteriovoracaceae bacterium]|nr:bifunctional 5,10-methylenetetrahydrofolate dehydrogenase/5,10-methenyltetrahydrofolate cyclohydrolase [Bacteriovoracaceae bacterium]